MKLRKVMTVMDTSCGLATLISLPVVDVVDPIGFQTFQFSSCARR